LVDNTSLIKQQEKG